MKYSNFDELNDKGKIVVKAKSKAAKDLEKFGSAYEQEAQNLKRAFNKGDDVIGKFKGKGKLAAFAGALALGSKFLKGEDVHADEAFKAGAEALNPLPFSMDEIKVETDKMQPIKFAESLKAELDKKNKPMSKEETRKQALEFGKYLASKRKSI